MHIRSDDADIAYDVVGEGTPLLMIMGLAADRRMWMLQVPIFSTKYRCITFDNRGVGESTAPPGPYSMEQMAADALAVLDAASADRAHVLGISMGGAIAQHLALKAPERVRSLVLASTWCGRNAYTQRMSDVGQIILKQGGPEAVTKASMLWLFTPRFILDRSHFVEQIEQMALQFAVHPEVFTNQIDALLEHDTCEQLARLDIPTRVIHGRRDILVPPELGERLAASIPGADLVMLEGGHAYQMEEFDAFNHAVLEFLEKN